MTKGQQVAAGITVLTVVLAVSAHRAAAGVGVPHGDAVAYHGAWQIYSRLAAFFGRQALRAEILYWAAVQTD